MISPDTSLWALIPAAGSGSRMRAALPKQYLTLLGRPVIAHTLERLGAHARVRGVLVGLAADDEHWKKMSLGAAPKLLGTFAGGATRAHTVLNGLRALAAHTAADDWVMVHDAVRPCLRLTDVDRLIAAAGANVDGALLALPVSDTVKRVNPTNQVTETVARANLWRALTPQLFHLRRLEEALRQALTNDVEITDEASAVEAIGGHPLAVAGHSDNIKITVPEDLILAALILDAQKSEH